MMSAHTPQCEAGHCEALATIDFGKYIQVVGIRGPVSGKTRYLCAHHGRGIKTDESHRITDGITGWDR